MELNEMHIKCLSKSLHTILENPEPGSMAYIRWLPIDIMTQLFKKYPLSITGWKVYLVIDEKIDGNNIISSDKAVELRESKEGNILLLVDDHAGAGLDGIYSAVREIKESDLMTKSSRIALGELERKKREFVELARRRAQKIGIRNTISPFKEFYFYGCCAFNPNNIGQYVSLIGLWPIEMKDNINKDDIELSAQVVQKLLLTRGSINTITTRINSLLLQETDSEQKSILENFLYKAEKDHWSDAVNNIVNYPKLWINNLKPGIMTQELRIIELEPWRRGPGRPNRWSGLNIEGESLVFNISRDDDYSQKLQVRWKTTPSELAEGSEVYKVSIITGSDNELISKEITHSKKLTQNCFFTKEDFEECDFYEEDSKWEAVIRVHPANYKVNESNEESPLCKETESFILTIGKPQSFETKESVGKKVRALVEEAIRLSADDFKNACECECIEDKNGFITYRIPGKGKGGRVYHPPLISEISKLWGKNGFALGRWAIKVRPDGSISEPPQFIEIKKDACEEGIVKKLEDITRRFNEKLKARFGFIGSIHHESELATNYVNVWINALDNCHPSLALANTVEIRSLSGETIGLIVLPSHPLRVAWHQAYDELAYHARYVDSLDPAKVIETLKLLDGSYFPAFLPGIKDGTSFIFGDVLGFHAVAMINSNESEPQASIALMAKSLSANSLNIAPSVGTSSAQSIAKEIKRYCDVHPDYVTLQLNAQRPGDGLTITKALGIALDSTRNALDEEVDSETKGIQGYVLDLYPSETLVNNSVVGRYLTDIAEKRRTGVISSSKEDRWILETFKINSDSISLPRLRWSKRKTESIEKPAHITVAFDTFDSTVEFLEKDNIKVMPIEGFGLFPSLFRSFSFTPVATWITGISDKTEGEKHPVSRALTDRLNKIHSAILRLTVNDEEKLNKLPILKTQIRGEKADTLHKIHELSDWVITLDRNVGIEFFDSPLDNKNIYETYVIDCVPEREDIESTRLVTSTVHIEEVLKILDNALIDMGLSCSPRNCSFLLSKLKAVSGRLAMRLSSNFQNRGELISLSMFYGNCESYSQKPEWLSLEEGFIVPLDDVRDLLLIDKSYINNKKKQVQIENEDIQESENDNSLRADLVYIDLSKKGDLRFTFIELKYRRLLRSAKSRNLLNTIQDQTSQTRLKWLSNYFDKKMTSIQTIIKRRRLARALRFYLNKAHRHNLCKEAFDKLNNALDKLYQTDYDLKIDDYEDRGYIFCPEYNQDACEVDFNGRTRIFLFGPEGIPEFAKNISLQSECLIPNNLNSPHKIFLPLDVVDDKKNDINITVIEGEKTQSKQFNENPKDIKSELEIELGNDERYENIVNWCLSIKGNPHLMIVGLPGMGKTTSIINLCIQLYKSGITPIVFSYHDDIEVRLKKALGFFKCIDMEQGIGFNPLRVVGTGPYAWVDQVGMLRDIFSTIYPDFGDLQNNEIREAIKQSYSDLGYGIPGISINSLQVPQFQAFYDTLKKRAKDKSIQGVIARLSELNDYGFFRHIGEASSPLETTQPIVVRVHANQNDVIQNALSSFVLLNIYQNMFLRGEQKEITHAVIFDEAHRASKLKLLPTMAKECRKYGISLIVASQAAKDFDSGLYSAIANYLVLRVIDADAKVLAKNVSLSKDSERLSSRMKMLEKFTAIFFSEGKHSIALRLSSPLA